MNSGVTPEWVAPGAGRPHRPPLATPLWRKDNAARWLAPPASGGAGADGDNAVIGHSTAYVKLVSAGKTPDNTSGSACVFIDDIVTN
ncbi:hypothetical protein EVAR_78189_1 [Eumeta japonica]|uniref:Uncharacterized protein n=1 Tax=Eumeta variegata TaxID=151549 RepID=A0A4C1UZF1_EUMVA|nr:hypothetical protein EVAR_78189_1 [Eumeta japonica]